MKVLWITNIMLPPICKHLKLPVPVFGGWMYSSAQSILQEASDLELSVATVYNGKKLLKCQIDGILYYLLPLNGLNTTYHKELEPLWIHIHNDFQPDVVHLHGTEFTHGLAYLRANGSNNVVVSIQGLLSACYSYYNSGMNNWDIFRNITLRDILRLDPLWISKYKFYKRSKSEIEIIKRCNHIIGRTSWDRARTWAINSKSNYYFCNETLRSPFYKEHWDYRKCEPHTIFISQAGYPIKGLHQLLKSLPLVLKFFPDTKVYVAGSDIINTSTLFKKICLTGYGKYLKKMIKKKHLASHVVFTGLLDEVEMCKYYLRSNVFVCPSSIENSPNSLGEAQILGMPCVASYVGGIPDMMKGFEKWMYRFDEVEMLAERIVTIFKMGKEVDFKNSLAKNRHDKSKNAVDLLHIYLKILNE